MLENCTQSPATVKKGREIVLFSGYNKNVKECALFNIFSEKPDNTIVLKTAKIPHKKY